MDLTQLPAGVTAVVKPGGSVRDAEVAAAADRHGMAMVATGPSPGAGTCSRG